MIELFNKNYTDESLIDLEGDLHYDFFQGDKCETIPRDEDGFHTGTFKVTINWEPEK